MQIKSFKVFLKDNEDKRLKILLDKIPASHKSILKDVSIEFQNSHTLKGSKKYVGMVDDKEFKIAAPWHYGREFVILHEIAHLVYEYLLTDEEKKKWKSISPKDSVESFCHAYANFYSKHKIKSLDKKEHKDFISKLS